MYTLISLVFNAIMNHSLSTHYRKLARKRKGPFLMRLASSVGVSIHTAKSYVLGARRLQLNQLASVADLIGVDESVLIDELKTVASHG